jgi:nuclear pore complex protein Nup188
MAPVKPQGNVYYPSLAECFSGEQQLLSWESAYSALCDPETASTSEVLRAFLSNADTINILINPFSPYSPPDQRSKSKFETATAPIHVTSSSTGDYNIDEIKADSLWLSEQTKIDEPAALRIAILEWQGRQAAQLLGGFTEEESISVQEAAGISNLGASTFVANSSILAAPGGAGSDTSTQFNSADQRKLRLLNIYLSERIYILRISQILICWGAAQDLRSKYGADYRVCDEWLETIGQTIVQMQLLKGNTNDGAPFLSKCLKAIDQALTNLEEGSKWTVPESIEEVAEEKWRTSQATELVHILHLTFVHIDLFIPKFVPASIMLAWFESMATRNFFVGFQLPLPGQQPLVQLIHLLISLISLTILKIHIVLEDLDTDEFNSWDKSFYVLNGTLIEEVTNTFGYAERELGPNPGTPAAFAWSVITFRLTAQAGGLSQEGNYPDSLQQQTPLADAVQYLTRSQETEFFGKSIPYEVLAEQCSAHNVFDLIAQLIKVGMSAFGTNVDRITRDRMRINKLEFIQASLASEVVMYSPEIILVAHTILAGNRTFWDWVENTDESHADPITSVFLQDTAVLRPALFGEAQLRYPYETIPLLKFCSALTRGEKSGHDGIPDLASILLDSKTLMQRLPQGFRSYSLVREEENSNFIALTTDLPQFSASLPSKSLGSQRRQFGLARHAGSSDSIIIPRGTEGRIVDDTAQPFVAVWHYSHSALKLMVTLLSTCMVGSGQVEYASQESASIETATEIIGFFADVLNSSIRASKKLDDGGACSTELLEALHIGTEQIHDTVNIVLAIFEQELLSQCQQPGTDGSMELLVNCTHFIYALIAISPARVWPWLARSRLLESDGNGGSLASILIGTEMVTGRYDFLIGCIRIFHALVEDTIHRSVARKAPSRAVARFGVAPTSGSGTSEKVISSTLITFGRTLASIFESALSWKYARVEDRLLINTGLMEGFATIFDYAYGVDDSPKVSEKLSGLLAPIAEYLADLFMSKTGNDLPTNPILASLLSATDLQELSILTSSMDLWSRQTRAALRFSNTIIQVAIMLNRPWTHLEQQLFKATPLLARLYATSDAYKSSVVQLFESLVRGAVRSVELPALGAKLQNGDKEKPTEPPSLLGHLGRQTAKNFLSILSLLDKPLKIIDIQTNVWNLLTAVVSCRQQWFALYLLTGTTPRESVRSRSSTSESSKGKALLTRALDELSNIDITKPRKTVAMLEFVSAAQNNWSWAMAGLRQHKGFIKGLLNFLKHLKDQDGKTEAEIIRKSYENKIASAICEILAMYLHTCRQVGDFSALKEVIPNLTYLEKCALQLPSYNTSLHTNLRRNFESKFPGFPLASFKRTTLRPAQFGRNYFYDIELADRLLGFNSSWKNNRSGGFHDEVVRANINLGLVESQIMLLHNWRLLAVELSNGVTRDERLPKILANIVRDCMKANTESVLPEVLFGRLMIVRAELSFSLLQKMVNLDIEGEAITVARRLLIVIWTAIRTATPDFDNVFSSDQVQYYRLLLRVLFLSLNFHRERSSANDQEKDFRHSFRASIPAKENRLVEPISTQLLEILQEVVAKGFRSLATQLHSDPDTVAPTDFALITAILQLILRIPEMQNWHGQIALVFANSNTIRYAASLFSWSDRLAIDSASPGTPPDPIYGELSLLFLLSLSSMQVMAEHMAVENLLSQLNTANIMNYYRRPDGMGPFNPPTRIFSIWTRGLLPLILNLLRAIGHPIAAEIATFLNQFPQQLQRASASLSTRNNSRITLALASETHSLALIYYMLEQYRIQGPAIGIQANDIPALEWEAETVRDDLDGALAQKGALRSRIFPGDEREVELSGRKAGGAGTVDGETELEQRVIEELEAAGLVLGVGASGSQTS